MNKSLIICDRLIYGALLGMVFILPYSLALIATCQTIMIIAWLFKHFLLSKEGSSQSWPQSFSVAFRGMVWPLIALAVLIALMIPFSHSPVLSLRKFFTRFLQQIFLAYVVTEIINNRKRLYTVLAVLLFTLFLVSVDAMAQYICGKSIVFHTPLIFGRVLGPMHHPNDLGTLLVTVLPVVLVLLISCPKWISLLCRSSPSLGRPVHWMRWVMLVLFLILVSVLGLTSSRGAWVSFAVSMLVLSFFLRRKGVIVCIISMLAIFFGIFGMYCLSTRFDLYNVAPVKVSPSLINPWGMPAQHNALQLLSGSSGREYYWDTAIGIIKHNPWFGCGYSAYVQALRDFHTGHEEYPHNSLLHITAELGLVGLFLYGWLFVALCVQGWKVLQTVFLEADLYLLGCGISCGIMAWMVHSLVDTPWSSLQLSLLLWLLVGMLLSLCLILRGGPVEEGFR